MNDRHQAFLFVLAIPLVLLACKSSTEPVTPTFLAQQVPGCIAALGKGVAVDSCFSYSFHDALVLDFCMSANCCPDSNRFAFRHSISHDTILVVASDTAAHNCRCNCSYLLHTELHSLERDEYLVLCAREDYSSQYIFYAVRVKRS